MDEDPAAGRPSGRRGSRLGGRAKVAVGVAVLLAVVLVAWLRLDVGAVVAAARRADPPLLAAGAVAALLGLGCGSEAMRRLLPPGARRVAPGRGFLLYATGALVRNALPVGYASSIAVLGYVYRREAAISLDRSLAAVSVAEFLNAVASTVVAVTGILLLVTLGPASPLVVPVAIVGAAVVVGGASAAGLLWYRRETVERIVHGAVTRLAAVVDRLAGRERRTVSPEAVEVAIGGYYRSLSSVSDRRRAVGVSLGFSVLAWVALVASLYACGLAIGYRVPAGVALLVIPLAGYASVLPLPGGLGGYELGVTGALVALAGTDVVVAVAATLLFRLCSYWLVIALGGVASTVVSVDLRDLRTAAGEGPSADR